MLPKRINYKSNYPANFRTLEDEHNGRENRRLSEQWTTEPKNN